jgi:hypothetical protein
LEERKMLADLALLQAQTEDKRTDEQLAAAAAAEAAALAATQQASIELARAQQVVAVEAADTCPANDYRDVAAQNAAAQANATLLALQQQVNASQARRAAAAAEAARADAELKRAANESREIALEFERNAADAAVIQTLVRHMIERVGQRRLTAVNLALAIASAMTVVAILRKKDRGPMKKELVIKAAKRMVEQSDDSFDDKAAMYAIIDTVAPGLIEVAFDAARGTYQFGRKWTLKCCQ